MACLQIYETERLLKQAEIAAAMTLEALMANMKPYDARLHKLRGFQGAVTSAENIKHIIEGSDLLGKVKVKVQDAYSMRSTPQVLGAARDQLRWTRSQIEIELNGVGDNPIFLADDKVVLTGANFQGSPISVPLDMMGACVTMACVISERRLNRLLNPALSVGLPAFLTKGAGMYSGHMLSQYTADMLIVEQRILSMPASIQSIPAAADQEDFVSMGMNTALKTRQIIDNAYGILGIEFIAAAQALDFREFHPGQGHAGRQGSGAQGRRPPGRGPAALPRPQRHDGDGQEARHPARGRGRHRRAEDVLDRIFVTWGHGAPCPYFFAGHPWLRLDIHFRPAYG